MEEIYKKYSKQIYGYLLCLTHNKDLSEELTQETFYKAIKNIKKFRGDCKIDVWLCQIAKNLYYNEFSKKKKIVSLDELKDLQLVDTFSIENDILDKDDKLWLYKEIEKLDPICRNIVILRIKLDLSFSQIGNILNISENYARVYFYRSKQTLKNSYNYKGD